MVITILLLCSLASDASATEHIIVPPIGRDLVPPAPYLPEGLPQAVKQGDDVLLPKRLAGPMWELIEYCADDYPRVVKAAIDEVRLQERVTADGRVRVQQELCRYSQVALLSQQQATGWSTTELLGTGAVGIVVGAIIGAVVMSVVH